MVVLGLHARRSWILKIEPWWIIGLRRERDCVWLRVGGETVLLRVSIRKLIIGRVMLVWMLVRVVLLRVHLILLWVVVLLGLMASATWKVRLVAL